MSANRLKIIVIVGPTASGKSELGVKLAKKFNGEVISADSRQVYRGLDIGTGKVPGSWQLAGSDPAKRGQTLLFAYKSVPHHCIDFVPPKRTFTVAEYKKCAEAAIEDITRRGKIPVLVGGTGFWIYAVVYDLSLPPAIPNPKLRKQLEKKRVEELLKILRKLDPERAKTIEQKNPRRLIRAIEIARTLGRIPKIRKRHPYSTLWLGIRLPRETLKKRIHRRLVGRLKKGMIREAKRLRDTGMPWKRFYELGLEYRFLADYLRRRVNQDSMTEKLERVINGYARRQTVWFKKNRAIHWTKDPREAEMLAKKFLTV